jgi:hypothetical protein
MRGNPVSGETELMQRLSALIDTWNVKADLKGQTPEVAATLRYCADQLRHELPN